jgi:hypothetical protein
MGLLQARGGHAMQSDPSYRHHDPSYGDGVAQGGAETERRERHDSGKIEAELLKVLLGWIQAIAGEGGPTRKPPFIPLLTFADTVRYFIDGHPGDPDIVSGALLRQPHPAGSLMFQVFLDRSDRLCADRKGKPYGRVFVAGNVDHELAQQLQGVDLVLFR